MEFTGKIQEMTCNGKTIRYCNQRSREWTHLYEYQNCGSTLCDAGCGIFSIVHAIEWMHGIRLDPDMVADFSVACGGRGDDGTDRPVMLAGMMAGGFAEKYGFSYNGDGLLNDHEQLWAHMKAGNAALCNLRVGHIVALVDWREVNGKRQLLAIDSVAESASEKVRDRVCELVSSTEVLNPIRNKDDMIVGGTASCAMFWVDADLPKDFNLLYKTEPKAEKA